MSRLPLLLATAAVAFAVVAFPARADALGPVDIEIAATAGTAVGSLGPFGFGIGGRAGVSVLRLYAGVQAVDYLGATSTCKSCSAPPGSPLPPQWRAALLYGFEGGYDFNVSLVTIRPQLGLGNFRRTSRFGETGPANPGTVSNTFYVEPGVVVLVSFRPVFFGADVGAFLGPDYGLTVHGQIGVRF